MKLILNIRLKGTNGFEAGLEEEIQIDDRQAGFAAIAEYASRGFPPCNAAAIQSVTFTFDEESGQ